jgi:hypothetical protein
MSAIFSPLSYKERISASISLTAKILKVSKFTASYPLWKLFSLIVFFFGSSVW